MTCAASRLPSLADQCQAAAARGVVPRAWPANPLPPGIRGRSTTAVALEVLVAALPGCLTAGQLRHRCQAGRGAIAWAMRYLVTHGMARSLPDHRQSNYLRYRATPQGVAWCADRS